MTNSWEIRCPHCGSPTIKLIKTLGSLVKKYLCYPCGKTFLNQIDEWK